MVLNEINESVVIHEFINLCKFGSHTVCGFKVLKFKGFVPSPSPLPKGPL